MQNMELTQKELAGVFGVTARTIRAWDKAGLAETRCGSGGSGPVTYDLPAAIRWRLERERVASDDAFAKARLRKVEAQAREIELRVEEAEGTLVDLDEVEADLALHLSRIRQGVTALPGRIVPRLGRYPHAEALAIIEPIVHDLLESLSRTGDPDYEE